MRRVVITGIGVISPIGIGSKAFWDNLLAGQGRRPPHRVVRPGRLPLARSRGEVPAYKIGDYVPKSYRKATKVMARDIELAVVAADDAFKDAGLQSKAYTDTPDDQPAPLRLQHRRGADQRRPQRADRRAARRPLGAEPQQARPAASGAATA